MPLGTSPALIVALCLGLAGGLGIATPATAADVLGAEALETRLVNGLQLVVIPWRSPGVVAFVTLVRTGSRDEVDPGRSGFAHLFEHMMFRGTPRYPEARYNRVLQRLGAESNAYTGDDTTLFYLVGAASGLETMMDLESDRFVNLDYGREVFRTEALAVLGEYNTSAANPLVALGEALRELAFDRHPYGHTPIGRPADIRTMPEAYDYSRQFFTRHYRPENTILLLVGDVQPEQAAKLARRYYGDWHPPPAEAARAIPVEPPQTAARRRDLHWHTAISPALAIGYRAPAFSAEAPDSAAIDVLANLLFAESAPLYLDLVVERHLADLLVGGLTDHRDPYLFEIYARATSDAALVEIERAIAAAISRLQEEPPAKERLEPIKSYLRNEFALALDAPDAVAFAVASYLGVGGSLDTIERVFDRYASTTGADVQRLARSLFDDAGKSVVRMHSATTEER